MARLGRRLSMQVFAGTDSITEMKSMLLYLDIASIQVCLQAASVGLRVSSIQRIFQASPSSTLKLQRFNSNAVYLRLSFDRNAIYSSIPSSTIKATTTSTHIVGNRVQQISVCTLGYHLTPSPENSSSFAAQRHITPYHVRNPFRRHIHSSPSKHKNARVRASCGCSLILKRRGNPA
ncbi:hypothetical protein IQ06DRAFT_144473 [Phaeosphaeriaceae sp. SRC1lsM3a]|nr:hypothetical protein IQ06DRAFT_144473 [Stagonospora sp. SRC1lsM3a]